MKRSTLSVMSAAMLMGLLSLTACAEKDHMAMDSMDKQPMHSEMKDDSKKMGGEMAKPMDDNMKGKADTMKKEMDSSMGGEIKKME